MKLLTTDSNRATRAPASRPRARSLSLVVLLGALLSSGLALGRPRGVVVRSRSRSDARGYVRSVQRVRIRQRSVTRVDATSWAMRVQRAYAGGIAKRAPLVRSRKLPGDRVALALGPLTLVVLGPPQAVAGKPGVVRRHIERGLLVQRGERGKGFVDARVARRGEDVTVEVALKNYRSPLRGRKRRAPLRQWLYRHSQLAVHERVVSSFLRDLVPQLLDGASAR